MNHAYINLFTANLVSFAAGTIVTWSSPEIEKITDDPSISSVSTEEGSWISALCPLGATFGPSVYGILADRIGRKYTLLAAGLPVLISYLSMAFGKSLGVFYAARFIGGFGVGGIFTVVPMYIGEIAKDSNRGMFTSAMNVFLCSGMLFSYSLGPYVGVCEFNLILALFPLIFIVLFFLLGSESPHYYITAGKQELAKVALQKIRGLNVKVETEMSTLEREIEAKEKGGFRDIFKSKGPTKAFLITVVLVAIQELSGINAVLFYAQTIFQDAKTDLEPAICSIIIGVVMFGTSFVAPAVVERLGRKFLLLASAIGMIISEVPLGLYCYLQDHGHDVSSVSFLPLLCLIVYIVSYNCGFGPLPWAIMGELFPAKVKSVASSTTAGICWFIAFLSAKYFATISDAIGIGPSFWIFSAVCLAGIPFIIFVVIETKGKPFQQIQEELER